MNMEQHCLKHREPWSVAEPVRAFLEGGRYDRLSSRLPTPDPRRPRAKESPARPGQFQRPFLRSAKTTSLQAIIAQAEGGQGNSTGMTQVIAAETGRRPWPTDAISVSLRSAVRNTSIPCLYEGLVLTAGEFFRSRVFYGRDASGRCSHAGKCLSRGPPRGDWARGPDEFSVAESKSYAFAVCPPFHLRTTRPPTAAKEQVSRETSTARSKRAPSDRSAAGSVGRAREGQWKRSLWIGP